MNVELYKITSTKQHLNVYYSCPGANLATKAVEHLYMCVTLGVQLLVKLYVAVSNDCIHVIVLYQNNSTILTGRDKARQEIISNYVTMPSVRLVILDSRFSEILTLQRRIHYPPVDHRL